ncbi:phage tail protein [Thiococcus pfennigii]|uniref:phage tail protein n=1 Tax=Thiococcus pfennigii TaxID=1057 RepID=UPI0019053A0D|nr:phage tail protein [Thiococcus pfennigii]MBK1699377.1 hypothetical protein [Thiococcus pfennigii]
MGADPGFRYLNLENRWPGCDYASHGLSVGDDGGLRLAKTSDGYRRTGAFIAGPIVVSDRPTDWQLLRVDVSRLPSNAHVRFFTLSSDRSDGSSSSPAPMVPWDAAATVVTSVANHLPRIPLDTWQAFPLDALHGRIFGEPGCFLWVAGALQGDGAVTPLVDQVRVDFDQVGSLSLLPEIYQHDESHAAIDPLLRLFEQPLGQASDSIDGLAALCHPWSAPDDGVESWLDWLAGWLGVNLDETWSESQRRCVVALAFGAHAKRGTAESLQNYLAQYGFRTRIEEAGSGLSLWSLDDGNLLGCNTQLAPAPPDGAVLGRTAIPNGSNLSPPDRVGAPLHEDWAHCFRLGLYAAESLSEDDLARIRRLIDRERLAHMSYSLCVILPLMRVGVQARIGVDAVVAARPRVSQLDTSHSLGGCSRLRSTDT